MKEPLLASADRGREALPLAGDASEPRSGSEIREPRQADEEREAVPLPGDPSASTPGEVLGEALANVKERWAEVNQEALNAGTLPVQGEEVWAEGFDGMEDASSRPLQEPSRDDAPQEGRDITETRRTASPAEVGFSPLEPEANAAPGEVARGAETQNGLQRQLASRYENLATSLSSPHPTQPIVDLFA
jgi:hypothetical protein